MKLKNPNCDETQNTNCDETQKLKLRWNSKAQIVIKLKNLKCHKTKKKLGQNSNWDKTQNVKKSNCDKTQIVKKLLVWKIQKLKSWQNSTTLIVIKLKSSIYNKKINKRVF